MLSNNQYKNCEYMQKVLETYEKIRGSSSVIKENTFWDAVIISASDFDQEVGYELQISRKKDRGEIPLTVPFHVFSDPPGYKIGCGGSTLYILNEISKIYGNAMSNMRFLLIPAGGYSQRLPNLTVLGKLFSPLPFGNYHMLDLILASYLPFIKRMSPGVFLASSDAIISYTISEDDEWTFSNEGFTALAHPSHIDIGTTHGVYVLPENQNSNSKTTFMSECLCVLQKPSIREMYEKGAVVKNIEIPGLKENDEIIFSDSAFFFDYAVVKLLINIYENYQPLKCELSSYGEFLRALGTLASPSYITNKSINEELSSLQTVLYKVLSQTKLSICVLKKSNFHHLGTMQEYIDSLCYKNSFSVDFPVTKFSFSSLTLKEINPSLIQGTVISSVIHPLSAIPSSTLMEYCDINVPVDVGQNSIISNVQLSGCSAQCIPIRIPDNVLIHTIPLNSGFVTISFSIQENIKKLYKRDRARKMMYFGREFQKFLKRDSLIFSYDFEEVSLWDAKLFPICETSEYSFKKTLELVLYLKNCEGNSTNFFSCRNEFEWISMRDIMELKDTKKLILYQENLFLKITQILKINENL